MSNGFRDQSNGSPEAPEIEGEDGPRIYPRSSHPISRKLIDEDALKTMYRLIRHGHKAYLVGGGVRDLLLGKRPKDFDIATDATPRKIKSIFRNCRIIGRRFKLAHIYFRDNKIFELSTFRDSQAVTDPNDAEEIDEDTLSNQASDNVYGTEQTDALRRDLTINGLFYDLSTFSIIDYVGGMQDLQDGLVRVIGDPTERFIEDPVRMIRAIRHAARAGFHIEESCWNSILENHALIRSCASMRVFEEFKKDLLSGSLFTVTKLLHQAKLLGHLLPDLAQYGDTIFKPTGYFAHVISGIDRDALDNLEVSQTAALSVFPLLALRSDGNFDQPTDYQNKDEIHEYIHHFYRDLLVPKREKERIADILALFLRFTQLPDDKLEKMNLERRRSISEVSQLFEWMMFSERHDRTRSILQNAADKRVHSGLSDRDRTPFKRQRRSGRYPQNKKKRFL